MIDSQNRMKEGSASGDWKMVAQGKPDSRMYVSRLVANEEKTIHSGDAQKIAGSFLARLRLRIAETRQKREKKDAPRSSLESVS